MESSDYSDEIERLNSFENWPETAKQNPNILSKAGFYYTGEHDAVRCYTCTGGFKDWESSDDPWEEHAMWYGDKCYYVQYMKGNDYIRDVKLKYDIEKLQNNQCILPSSLSSVSTSTGEKVDNKMQFNTQIENINLICRICCVNVMDTIIYPCMHVVSCMDCTKNVQVCPVCRKNIINRNKFYLS